jgi:hypothetical protein
MKTFFGLILMFLVFQAACAEITLRTTPSFFGVDERTQPYVDEYLALSTQNNMHFSHAVSIGLKRLNMGAVVGLCSDGGYFREITIDDSYWARSNDLGKEAVLLHELTHCYCDRGHDFEGVEYPESDVEKFWDNFVGNFRPKFGYYDDGCPKSMMFPAIIPEKCLINHNEEYKKELFVGCKEW